MKVWGKFPRHRKNRCKVPKLGSRMGQARNEEKASMGRLSELREGGSSSGCAWRGHPESHLVIYSSNYSPSKDSTSHSLHSAPCTPSSIHSPSNVTAPSRSQHAHSRPSLASGIK